VERPAHGPEAAGLHRAYVVGVHLDPDRHAPLGGGQKRPDTRHALRQYDINASVQHPEGLTVLRGDRHGGDHALRALLYGLDVEKGGHPAEVVERKRRRVVGRGHRRNRETTGNPDGGWTLGPNAIIPQTP